jgi:enoyl-[acyl-carrier protein] reductase I
VILNGKRGVVLGVANKRSIAWAIAKSADAAGAELCLTAQNDRFLRSLEELQGDLGRRPLLLTCDVAREEEMDRFVEELRARFGPFDFLVHCLAYARKEDLEGGFKDTPWAGWETALRISAYSFPALVRRVLPLLEGRSGSFLTLSYLGAERVIPNYNIMGVAKASLEAATRYLAAEVGPLGHRANAISAGPIKTLAAAGVSGFGQILEVVPARAPLRRNVEAAEVGDAAVFLLSPLSRGVTGEILHVDCGFHAVGL